jgi:Fur family peroxide stress response transcriptional regulator
MIYNSVMQAVRETKYTQAIIDVLTELGHGTNSDIALKLRKSYPEVSDTTVHRVTARLAERAQIGSGPRDLNGNLRYDANTEPHDHFICTGCKGIRDIDIANEILPVVQEALGGCGIDGRLEIKGLCTRCNERGAS